MITAYVQRCTFTAHLRLAGKRDNNIRLAHVLPGRSRGKRAYLASSIAPILYVYCTQHVARATLIVHHGHDHGLSYDLGFLCFNLIRAVMSPGYLQRQHAPRRQRQTVPHPEGLQAVPPRESRPPFAPRAVSRARACTLRGIGARRDLMVCRCQIGLLRRIA